jgi:hypothetical protein
VEVEPLQGADELGALSIEAVGQHHTEVEAAGEQVLDDFEGQLRLGFVAIAGLEARLGLKHREEQRERGRPEQSLGVDRDHPIGERVQIADVLVGHVVGGVALLRVPRLIDTEG